MNRALIKFVLISAVRDKIILSLLFMIAFSVSTSLFLGSSAIIESDKFAVVYAGSLMRVAGVLGLILFTTFSIRRLFDSKEVDFILACPISRPAFVGSVVTAYGIIGTLLAGLMVLVLYGLYGDRLFLDGLTLWGVSLVMEYILIAAATVFFGLYISSAASCALITIAFYVLARLIGQFLDIADNTPMGHGIKDTVMHYMLMIFDGVSLFIPRLDLIAQSSWLIYGVTDSVIGYVYVFIHGGVFALILVVAAIVDLLRRQF